MASPTDSRFLERLILEMKRKAELAMKLKSHQETEKAMNNWAEVLGKLSGAKS